MSYDNAEPKILKTLNSSGQVLDDSGNVISDTTDYWEKVYNEADPKPDKILHSDGTIKDSAGNLIQDTTEFNVKKYNQAEPIPAKYLHSDGTIDENPGGGSSGGSAAAYCWNMSDGGSEERGVMYFNFDKAPADLAELNQKKVLVVNIEDASSTPYLIEAYALLIGNMGVGSYTRGSDTEMQFQGITFTRNSNKDFTLW